MRPDNRPNDERGLSSTNTYGLWRICLLAIAILACGGANLPHAPSVDLEVRRKRLDDMSPEQKARIDHNRQRFAAFGLTEQQALRKLADELEADPEAERLRHVMAQYHDWLKKLSPGQRAEILELPLAPRVAKIKHLRADQAQRAQQQIPASSDPVTVADYNKMITWFEDFALKHQATLLQDVPPERREHIESLGENKLKRSLLWLLVKRGRTWLPGVAVPMSAADITDLAGKLSAPARDQLLGAANIGAQRQLARRWLQTALRHRTETSGWARAMPMIAQQDLQQFFQHDLTSEQREQLLAMPPEQMQRELRKLFFQQPNHTEASPTNSTPPDPMKPEHGGKHPKGHPKGKGGGKGNKSPGSNEPEESPGPEK